MIKKRLLALLSKEKKYIYLNVFFKWLGLLAQIAIVFAIANIIKNSVLIGILVPDFKLGMIVLIIGLVVKVGSSFIANELSYYAGANVKKVLRTKIYEKLLSLGMSYRSQVATSNAVQLSVEGVEQLEVYFSNYLPQFFYSLLAPITLFIILSQINFKASFVLLVCVPLIPISIVLIQKIAKRLLSKYWSVYAGLGDSFLENLEGLTTLKIYGADQQKAEAMDLEATKFRKITMKVLMMQLNSISVMDIVAYGGAAFGMLVAILEFVHGQMTFEEVLIFILLASEFFIPLRLLGSFFHIAMNGMAASDRIFAILDLEKPAFGTSKIGSNQPDISINRMSFGYDEERLIINNLNLDIPFGKFIALVGKSGCGKSTIANILVKKNSTYLGEIKFDGIELKTIKESSLIKNITLVKHDSYIFKGSIRSNLMMAGSFSDEQLWQVLKDVRLDEFVANNNGLDMLILDRGSNLSGGQRQRLAIARALLKDTPIYLFDEITSNLDLENEGLILDILAKLRKHKTIIMIAHRLASIKTADEIYLLEDGGIIEHGTHQQLLDFKQSYYQLYQTQSALEAFGGNDYE